MLLIGVSLSGGSCAVSELAANREYVPSRAELQEVIDARTREAEGAKQLPPEAVDRLHVLLTDMTAVLVRFRRFEVPFSLMMLLAYTAMAVVSMRALQLAPDSPRRISFVALIALPVRVANAAIDIATDQALIPHIRGALTELVSVLETEGAGEAAAAQYEATAQMLGDAVQFSLVGWDAATTLAVCLLFTYAWRYFQRPEVVDWFEKHPAAPPPIDRS